jgi:hypothetical protein
VRYDLAQTLTSAQQTQARSNIYAAPFDATADRGIQINGGMVVTEDVANTTVSGKYICAGWKQYFIGTMVITGTGGGMAFLPGFDGLLYVQVGTAQASMGANDYAVVVQRIEGYRISRLKWGTSNAVPITIGFWSAHARTGVYSGSITNGPNDRSYAFAYTQVASSIAQYNTVTIPGDTTGTWPVINTIGMTLTFTLACGSTSTAPSVNGWLAGSYFAAPGQVNGVAATTDIFRITGITIFPGTQSPTSAQSSLLMRTYDEDLAICRRYLQITQVGLFGIAASAGDYLGSAYAFNCTMRATPTVIAGGGSASNIMASGADNASSVGFRYYVQAAAPGIFQVVGALCYADARL